MFRYVPIGKFLLKRPPVRRLNVWVLTLALAMFCKCSVAVQGNVLLNRVMRFRSLFSQYLCYLFCTFRAVVPL
jgi:hypothetical protein